MGNKSVEDASITAILAQEGGFSVPTTDPMRGYYGVISGVLILEAISTLLAITVVMKTTTKLAILVLLILSCGMIFLCSKVKKSWFWRANLGLQILVLSAGFFHIGISIMGAFFIATWIYTVSVGKKVQSKIRRGELKGQVSLKITP